MLDEARPSSSRLPARRRPTTFWPDRGGGSVHGAVKVVLDSPDKVRSAVLLPQWLAVHKAFNDTVTKAVTTSAGHRRCSPTAPAGQQAAQWSKCESAAAAAGCSLSIKFSNGGKWRSHSASSTSIMARCSMP